jgi:hypothetical protein
MSVNGASMIFLYYIYFAIKNAPQMLGIRYSATVVRAQMAFWRYYIHCNGELNVGVTSALHFFSEYIFGGWKLMLAVICFTCKDGRCRLYVQVQKFKWVLKMSVTGASMIFVNCIYFVM